jgi:cold shock CspA family protein
LKKINFILKQFVINKMSSPSNRKTGHVKFFNSQKGFGFIIPNEPIEGEAQAEIFVHHTSIYNNGGFRSLAEGEEVEFDLVQGPKGLQATSVTGPNGGPVKGDPRAGRSNNMNQFRGYWQQGNFNGNGFRQGFNQQFGNQYAPNGQFFYSPQFQNQNQQAFTTQNTNQYIQATQAGYNQYPTNMNMNSMNTMNVMNAMNTMNTMNTMTNMSAMNAMNNMNTQTQ